MPAACVVDSCRESMRGSCPPGVPVDSRCVAVRPAIQEHQACPWVEIFLRNPGHRCACTHGYRGRSARWSRPWLLSQ
jgi:hypothetical protein